VRKGDYAETGIREARLQGYDVTNFSYSFRYFKLIDAFYLVNESRLPRPRDQLAPFSTCRLVAAVSVEDGKLFRTPPLSVLIC
jgi:hypothetical protein